MHLVDLCSAVLLALVQWAVKVLSVLALGLGAGLVLLVWAAIQTVKG